jgi:signal transduction histidine kinase
LIREEREQVPHTRGRIEAVASSGDEAQQRLPDLLERFAMASLASVDRDAMLAHLLRIFMDAAGADVAVFRARVDERLIARAAIGVEEEVDAAFAVSLDGAGIDWGGSGRSAARTIASVPADLMAWSDGMRRSGVRSMWCVPLIHHHDLVGAVYLGAREERELGRDEIRALATLARLAPYAFARRDAEAALEEAIRARDDVFAFASHDLRNPLNIISLAVSVLDVGDHASRTRAAEKIVRAVGRASRLVQDLVRINAIQAGKFSIESEQVDFGALIAAVADSQGVLAAEASVSLGTDLDPALGMIEADPERLTELFENLIGNSLKFTSPGGCLAIGAARGGEQILAWVKDTGSGIAREELPHVFDRFWQARNGARRGVGLGLTICKAIVEAHGGRIWAESELGVGTTMFFTLAVRRGLEPSGRDDGPAVAWSPRRGSRSDAQPSASASPKTRRSA